VKGLASLLRKEMKEQLRTYRFLIVGGIFVFFGITNPLTIKYLPQIIKLAGDQISIDVPPPTAAQSLVGYAGDIGQIGVLVAVLMAMGAIANELRHGTALMTLSKPVSRGAFVSSKLIALSTSFIVAMVVASMFCFAYTVLLIESADVVAFIGTNLLLALFLVFCLAVTLLFSSFFKSSLAAGGISIGIIIVQAVIAAVPVIGDYMPGKLIGWGNNLVNGVPDTYWWALAITLVVTGCCVYLAQRRLKNKDL
jgi:ABC-2 type transport system permease protein